jgi:hypothetical protein
MTIPDRTRWVNLPAMDRWEASAMAEDTNPGFIAVSAELRKGYYHVELIPESEVAKWVPADARQIAPHLPTEFDTERGIWLGLAITTGAAVFLILAWWAIFKLVAWLW